MRRDPKDPRFEDQKDGVRRDPKQFNDYGKRFNKDQQEFKFKGAENFQYLSQTNNNCPKEAITILGKGCNPRGGALFNASGTHYVYFGDYDNKRSCEKKPIDGCDNFFENFEPTDWFQPNNGPQCNEADLNNKNAYIDPFCFGKNNPSSDKFGGQKGCESRGNYWDERAQDCFPGGERIDFSSTFQTQNNFAGDIGLNQVATNNQPSKFELYMSQFKEVKDAAGNKGYCDSPIGRNDPMCRAASAQIDDFKFFDEFNDINNEEFKNEKIGRKDKNIINQLKRQIEEVNLNTNFTYCIGVEKAQSVLVDLEANPGIIRKIGKNMPKVFDALRQCEKNAVTVQAFGELQSEVNQLCESTGKEKLLAKINEISADPSSLFESKSPGQDPMRNYWKEFDKLKRECRRGQSSLNACQSIERDAKDIKMWMESDGNFGEDAPEKNETTEALANEALDIIGTALAKANEKDANPKLVCRQARKELCSLENRLSGDNSGGFCNEANEDKYIASQLGYDDNWIETQVDKYNEIDENQSEEDIMKLVNKLVEEKVAAVKESFRKTVTKLKDELNQIKAKFMDVESTLADNALFSQVTNDLNTMTKELETGLGKKRSKEINEKAMEELAANAVYFPEEVMEENEQFRQNILMAVNPIVSKLPANIIKEIPKIDDVLEKSLTKMLSETATDEITAAARTAKNIVEASTETNEKGEVVVKEGREKALVAGMKDFFKEFEESLDDKKIRKEMVKEGRRPDLKDMDDTVGKWYEKPILAATAKVEGQCAPIITGTGDGKIAPSETLSMSAMLMMVNRKDFNCKEGSKSKLGDLDAPEWVKGAAQNLIEAGVVTKDELKKDYNLKAPATRGDVAVLTIKSLEASSPEFKKIDFGECSLDKSTPDVSCKDKNAKYYDKAFKLGLMTGQGDGKMDLSGSFNRAQGATVMSLSNKLKAELKASGAAVITNKINPGAKATRESLKSAAPKAGKIGSDTF